MTLETLNLICIIWAAMGIASFILLQFVTAPYGRHVKRAGAPKFPTNLAGSLWKHPLFLSFFTFI